MSWSVNIDYRPGDRLVVTAQAQSWWRKLLRLPPTVVRREFVVR